MFLFALQRGAEGTWNSPTVIGLLVGSGLTAILFTVWEYHKGDDAMIPGSVAGRRTIICTTLFAFFHLGSITIATYYLPEWFQAVQGVDPLESGVRLLPSVLTNIVAAMVASGICESCQCDDACRANSELRSTPTQVLQLLVLPGAGLPFGFVHPIHAVHGLLNAIKSLDWISDYPGIRWWFRHAVFHACHTARAQG